MFKLSSLRGDAIRGISLGFELFDEGAGRDALIRAVEKLCVSFHIVASAGLFVDGDRDKLYLNLCRAAENWRRLHLHCARRGFAPPPAGKLQPLLGALAAPAWELARALASVSAASFLPEDEYEEEFLRARLWHALALSAPKPDGAGPVGRALDALDELGDPLSADAIALGRALVAGDAKTFEQTLLSAADAHEVATEKRARAFSTPTAFAPYRYLWFEGLAWIRCAERAGFSVGVDVPYCPPLARGTSRATYAGDWALAIGV